MELIEGSSIGVCNGINVVVDIEQKQTYMAQPGRQEWVTVIECISASGNAIPPYVIFKGEHLVSTWLPRPLPSGWTFTTNTSGWTNNFHGNQYICHFDKHTKARLDSPEEYRLLLCDGHDSHISAELCAYCLQNRIVLILLPPHSSHLLQPLDVGIFSPLKMALSRRQARLFRSGVRRIEKAEWTEHYYEARAIAMTERNILSAWRGAGLFPGNIFRVLRKLTEPSLAVISTPDSNSGLVISSPNSTPFLLTSSPPDPSTLHTTNQAFLSDFTSSDINQKYKNHVRRLSGITEHLQTEVTILKKELTEIKAIYGKRKERASGKRVILKGKTVVSTEEVQKALAEAEHTTRKKRKVKTRKQKRQALESEIDREDCDYNPPRSWNSRPDVVDGECIEVAL